jgi:hypothetical protein
MDHGAGAGESNRAGDGRWYPLVGGASALLQLDLEPLLAHLQAVHVLNGQTGRVGRRIAYKT